MSRLEGATALHLGMTLARAHASLQRVLDERLGTWHGLSQADLQLLGGLADAPQGRLSTLALAQALHLAPSALVRQLMPLEKTGLVARAPGQVQLRPAGRSLHAEARQTAEAACGQVCGAAGFDGEAAVALCAQLDAWMRGAARVHGGAAAR